MSQECVIDSQPLNSYLDEAERVAEIVETGVDSGNISDIANQIEKLSSTNAYKNQYVFDAPKAGTGITGMVIAVLFVLWFLSFAVTGSKVMHMSAAYASYGVTYITWFLIILFINGYVILKKIKKRKFIKRYSQYETILKYRNIELLDDLAAYTKQSSNKVIADLEYAIKRKLIPERHFGTDHMIILMSDDTYAKYQMHQTEFDRYYRKQLEERVRMEERSENIQSILNQGNIYIQAIRDSNAIIKDKEISQKLDKMEQIVTTIFHEVDINPGQAGKLGKFLSYYLPTMDKLLKAYIELGEKNVIGSNARKKRKEIEETLDTLNHAFEGILDKFYQEQELDIMSDIAAMKIMLRAVKKALIPGYGKKGSGWIKGPKKAAYNKIYRKTSFSIRDLFK